MAGPPDGLKSEFAFKVMALPGAAEVLTRYCTVRLPEKSAKVVPAAASVVDGGTESLPLAANWTDTPWVVLAVCAAQETGNNRHRAASGR